MLCGEGRSTQHSKLDSAPGHPLLIDDFHPSVEVVHVTHPIYGPSSFIDFQEVLLMSHFSSGSKGTDQSGTTCDSLGRLTTSTRP